MCMRVCVAVLAALVTVVLNVMPGVAAEAAQARPWHLTSSETWIPSDPSYLAIAALPRETLWTQPAAVQAPAPAQVTGHAAVVRRKEVQCLAVGLYHEARGESELGQIAVAQVILNRVASRKYPDTVCGVVFENQHRRNACQFSFACDGRSDQPRDMPVFERLSALAEAVMCHSDCAPHVNRESPLARLPGGLRRASHYHTTQVSPGWGRRIRKIGRIGAHIFYVSDRVMSSL